MNFKRPLFQIVMIAMVVICDSSFAQEMSIASVSSCLSSYQKRLQLQHQNLKSKIQVMSKVKKNTDSSKVVFINDFRYSRSDGDLLLEYQKIFNLQEEQISALNKKVDEFYKYYNKTKTISHGNTDPALYPCVPNDDNPNHSGQFFKSKGVYFPDEKKYETSDHFYKTQWAAKIKNIWPNYARHYRDPEPFVPKSIPNAVDNRKFFKPVENQGRTGFEYIHSCAAFATASAMETQLNRVDLSERSIYTIFSNQKPVGVLKNSSTYAPGLLLPLLNEKGVLEEKDCRWDNDIFKSQNRRTSEKTSACQQKDGLVYVPASYSIYFGTVPEMQNKESIIKNHIIEQLVASRHYPIVSISGTMGYETGEWIKFYSGGVGRAFVVVGYGNDLSPFSFANDDYFLIRNSLTDKGVHQKISKSNLYDLLVEILDIKDVNLKK